ncbi:hypothetical protein D0Y65_016984 [Glycine soja]|uniref:Uncharacterized protein n=1 Tax=Glycine soja TaxID=3848 RepID=A0A445JSU5_GLYSO|nr:hypothetical protein D0Y65_016984 [Glycine soja]
MPTSEHHPYTSNDQNSKVSLMNSKQVVYFQTHQKCKNNKKTYSIKLATCKRRSRLERGEPNGVPTYTPNQQRPEIYTKCTLESV